VLCFGALELQTTVRQRLDLPVPRHGRPSCKTDSDLSTGPERAEATALGGMIVV